MYPYAVCIRIVLMLWRTTALMRRVEVVMRMLEGRVSMVWWVVM
jgi:hypothetical protein